MKIVCWIFTAPLQGLAEDWRAALKVMRRGRALKGNLAGEVVKDSILLLRQTDGLDQTAEASE